MRQIGRIEHGNAKQFDPGVAIIDHLGLFIVLNATGFDLPDWGQVLTHDVARGVGRLAHFVIAALGPAKLAACQAGLIGEQYPHFLGKAFFQVALHLKPVEEHDGAIFIEHADIARGDSNICALIIGHGVGQQHPPIACNLDPADGLEGVGRFLIIHFIGLQLSAIFGSCRFRAGLCRG